MVPVRARRSLRLSRKPDASRPAGDPAIRRCAGRCDGRRGQACQGRPPVAVAVAANLHRQFWWPAIDFCRGFLNGKPAQVTAASGQKPPAATGASRMRPGPIRRSSICSSNPICSTRSSCRFRRSGAGRRQRNCSCASMRGNHRRDEPGELPGDQSGSDQARSRQSPRVSPQACTI